MSDDVYAVLRQPRLVLPLTQPLPEAPGSYALELVLDQPCTLAIGRLGVRDFPAGIYLYLGSAHGPGGLRKRLERHLRSIKLIRTHWHIDYLRSAAHLQAVAFGSEASLFDKNLECRWSQELAALPEAVIPVPRFGATDCRQGCRAHLVAFPFPKINKLQT